MTNPKQLREELPKEIEKTIDYLEGRNPGAHEVFDVLRIEIKNALQVHEQEVRNEITTFYEDILRDPIKLNNAMSALSEGNDKEEV